MKCVVDLLLLYCYINCFDYLCVIVEVNVSVVLCVCLVEGYL